MDIVMNYETTQRLDGDDALARLLVVRDMLHVAHLDCNATGQRVEVWTETWTHERGRMVFAVDPPRTWLPKRVIEMECISNGEEVWAYGSGFHYADFHGSHRAAYNKLDAQAVCDWLNQRERGYEVLA